MIQDIIEKAVVQGAIVTGVSFACHPRVNYIYVPLLGKTLPSYMVYAAIGAASSMVADGVHLFVKEEVHLKNKALDSASNIIGVAISTGALYAVMYVLNKNLATEYGLGCAIAAGAAGELGSSFLVNLIAGN